MENNKQHETHTHESNSQDKYFCPMKCEGEKVYDKPGNCPVCNMHLVLVSHIG